MNQLRCCEVRLHEKLDEGVHVEARDSLHQLLFQVFLQQVDLFNSHQKTAKKQQQKTLKQKIKQKN